MKPARALIQRLNDGRGITASFATSVLLRGVSAATTLIAMPIALATLGELRFGTFLMLFGIVNWIGLGSFGIQNALGAAIARGNMDTADISKLLAASLAYAVVTVSITVMAVALMFWAWSGLVGQDLALPWSEIVPAALLMMALSALHVLLRVFEGVRIGRLQLYATNLANLAGSGFAFACLIILPPIWPHMASFVIALNGGLVIGAGLNAFLIAREVRPAFSGIRNSINMVRGLAVSGLAFLGIGITALIQTHVPVLILVSLNGPEAGIGFGLYVRLLLVFVVGLGMISTPLWPALRQARAVRDTPWIASALRYSAFLVIGAGGFAGTFIALFGVDFVRLWTGHVLVEPKLFSWLFGIYFLQIAWSHYWATVLIGQGRERQAAPVFLAEGALMLGLGTVWAAVYGPVGMIAGLVAGCALATNWALPLLAMAQLHGKNGISGTKDLR